MLELRFSGSLGDFIRSLRDDRRFIYDTPEELLDDFREILEKDIRPKLLDLFTSEPRYKLEYIVPYT